MAFAGHAFSKGTNMKKKDEELSSVHKAVNAFNALQRKYRNFGASDSEATHLFRFVIESALDREDLNWSSLSPKEWQLYSASHGWEKVAAELTAAAKAVYDAVLAAPPKEVEWLRDYF